MGKACNTHKTDEKCIQHRLNVTVILEKVLGRRNCLLSLIRQDNIEEKNLGETHRYAECKMILLATSYFFKKENGLKIGSSSIIIRGCELDSLDSKQRPVACCYEYANKHRAT